MRVADVAFVGSGLVRPESVLVAKDGAVFAADFRGGVAAIAPDGSHHLIAGATADLPGGLKPNGIAFERDGSFILAHLGAEDGGIFCLSRDGQVTPLLRQVDGVDLPPTNYALRDVEGRLWVTVSTRRHPRDRDWTAQACTGFIVLMDARGARIVADGLGYTNECTPSPDGRFLYVNETYARRLSRFPLSEDGMLGAKQVVAEFAAGELPDGMAFDEEGCVWVTAIVANRLLRVDPASGRVACMLDGGDGAWTAHLAAQIAAATLTPEAMARTPSPLGNVSSIAFAGPGRRDAWLGCLLKDRIMRVAMPVAGAPPPHWRW
jgi:sugar lactone lactonase YvrE